MALQGVSAALKRFDILAAGVDSIARHGFAIPRAEVTHSINGMLQFGIELEQLALQGGVDADVVRALAQGPREALVGLRNLDFHLGRAPSLTSSDLWNASSSLKIAKLEAQIADDSVILAQHLERMASTQLSVEQLVQDMLTRAATTVQ